MTTGKAKPKNRGCTNKLKGPSCLIYAAHFLSAWGDRMWHFAVGLFLVYLDNKSLRLAAIYGFSSGSAVFLFGGLIGDWVDRNHRLKVVRTCLFIQNFAVIASAISVLLQLHYEKDIMNMLHGHMPRVMEAIIIILAIVAMLASVGCKIAIERDWIVVVAGSDKDHLANLNASTRAIDQLCKIISPLVVGQVMTFASLKVAAGSIAGWNLFSMFVEYFLLYRIYIKVPDLAKKKIGQASHTDEGKMVEMENREVSYADNLKHSEKGELDNTEKDNVQADQLLATKNQSGDNNSGKEKKGVTIIFYRFSMIFKGWPIYMKQKVVFAGMALSGLYMTVLGFDSVTIGYSYALNMQEWVLGLCMGLGGLTGIIATFIYPHARKAIGLERTGLFAFAAEIGCLTLCVISIWTPGSPSDMYKHSIPVTVNDGNCSNDNISLSLNTSFMEIYNKSYLTNSKTMHSSVKFNVNSTGIMDPSSCVDRPIISVALFLAGIITSRIGLWMADLTITQIMQENVPEHQRGVVSGVQSSLNMLLDMIKFLLVIVAPEARTFGILIIISFIFIILSGCLYSYHSWRVRGHLFHLNKITKCVNGDPPGKIVEVPIAE